MNVLGLDWIVLGLDCAVFAKLIVFSFDVSNIIYRVKYLYIDDFRKVGIIIDALHHLHSLGRHAADSVHYIIIK